jgi:hypothetical protein
MNNQDKFRKAFEYFKKTYSNKMGGSQTVVLPNGKSQYFDNCEFYSGRGSKYNSSIKHDHFGEVRVTRKEYSIFLKQLKAHEEAIEKMNQQLAEKEDRIDKAKSNGIYLLNVTEHGTYVELSDRETTNQCFDPKRLAKTLKISVSDAFLLNSSGKTYVFAKSVDGKIYELFHPALSCNDLSISVSLPSKDRLKEFHWDEWSGAPYSELLGQTNNKNHFIC